MDSKIVELGQRIASLRTSLGITQRKFALLAGVSGGYISSIESGQTAAGAQMLLSIANEIPNLNCRWLLTGEGEMFVASPSLPEQPQQTEAIENNRPTSPEVTEAPIPEPSELEDVLKAARMGGQATQWAVMEQLQHAGTRGLTAAELCEAVKVDADQIEGSLVVLKRKGVIKLVDSRYQLAGPTVGLKAKEIENAAQHVRSALDMLVTDLIPRVERGEKGTTLMTTEVRLPPGMATRMAQRILGNTMTDLQEAEKPDGEESLQVIMSFSTGMVISMPLKP